MPAAAPGDENAPANTARSQPPADKSRQATLHAYFRVDSEDEEIEDVDEDEEADDQPSTSGRDGPPLHLHHGHRVAARHALERQLSGRVAPWAGARWRHLHASGYTERLVACALPCARTLVLGSRGGAQPSSYIQAAEFDGQGELLLSGTEAGLVLVHSAAELVEAAAAAAAAAARRPPPGGAASARSQPSDLAPMLALDSGLPKLLSVRWNPSDDNVVGVAGGASRAVHLYDLQHTQGRPRQALLLPPSGAGPGAGDLAFFSRGSGAPAAGGGYSLLAGGPGGQVFLWDARAGDAPAATLQILQGGAVAGVALTEGDRVVVAGTAAGEVRLWDLRGGSGGALRFGGVVHHHPSLACVNLRAALARVPGLAAQAGGVPAAAVHSMQMHPRRPDRLGFHLACGWSGVLDLAAKEVTHVHAPPQPWRPDPAAGEGEGDDVGAPQAAPPAVPGLRRRACWSPDGARFAVPSRCGEALALLDFADCRHAGCYALGAEEGDEEEEEAAARVPPAVSVPLRRAAVCAAAMPGTELLVAGSADHCFSLVAQS